MTIVRVYLAASFSRREEIKSLVPKLEGSGFECTSSWLNSPYKDMESCPIDQRHKAGRTDLCDVLRSDCLILFNDYPSTTGGRHVETGLAIGKSIPIVLIGERTNIFHYTGDILDVVDNFDSALIVLKRLYNV